MADLSRYAANTEVAGFAANETHDAKGRPDTSAQRRVTRPDAEEVGCLLEDWTTRPKNDECGRLRLTTGK